MKVCCACERKPLAHVRTNLSCGSNDNEGGTLPESMLPLRSRVATAVNWLIVEGMEPTRRLPDKSTEVNVESATTTVQSLERTFNDSDRSLSCVKV